MIIGTGIDLIELARIQPLTDNRRFIERVLTPDERDIFDHLTSAKRKREYLAGRFSAKEAYAKAKGTGIGPHLSWQDIKILSDDLGRPSIIGHKIENEKVHVSITHSKDYAAATVTIERS